MRFQCLTGGNTNLGQIHSILKSQSKSRLVGANAPGIISAIGRCRIGFQPLPTFSPGHIGIVAKSGTLSYETVGSLTRAGVGQSLCIGMGGDVIAGTNFVDALKVFETDDDTQAIILVGELGGTNEEEAADWIKDYNKRVSNPKPIAACIGGFQAKPGKVTGHAGAWTGLGEGTSEVKYRALEAAGVTMVDHPAKFGGVMKDILSQSGRNVDRIVSCNTKHAQASTNSKIGAIRSSGTSRVSHVSSSASMGHDTNELPAAEAITAPVSRAECQNPQTIQHQRGVKTRRPTIKSLPGHITTSRQPLSFDHRRTNRKPRSVTPTRAKIHL